MMKRTIQTLILSAALMGFGTGCELVEALEHLVEDTSDDLNAQDDHNDQDQPDSEQQTDPDSLTDEGWSEEQDWACEEELDLCLQDAWSLEEDGVPIDEILLLDEACFDTFAECLGYEDPAWDEDLDEDGEHGEDGDCPDDDWSEEHDWACEADLDVCLQDVWSLEADGVPIDEILLLEEECFGMFGECLGYEDPAWNEGDDWADDENCDESLDVCLDEVSALADAGIDPSDVELLEQECFEVFEVCLTGDASQAH